MEASQLDCVVGRFRALGFSPKIYDQNFSRRDQFAGDEATRVAALHEAFADPNVRAVMLTKSGYGTMHLLDKLDYALIARNPKIFVGYSDATALLLSIAKECNIVTFHGPMLYDLRNAIDKTTWLRFEALVLDGETVTVSKVSDPQVKILRDGTGVGQLIGGNLTLLTHMIGTRSDFDTAGRVLFIEDVDEKLYSIDRLLLHLRMAGKFEHLAALVVGEMHDITDDRIPFGATVDDLVLKHTAGTRFPIVSNVPFGHGERQLTIPIGVNAQLEVADELFDFSIVEPSVSQ